jgi:hypothetical protein
MAPKKPSSWLERAGAGRPEPKNVEKFEASLPHQRFKIPENAATQSEVNTHAAIM